MQSPYPKQRLIGVVSILLIAGFFGTSIASYLVSLSSLREEILNKGLPLTSDNIYSEIQNDFLRPVFISSMMASDTFLRDWALSGEQDVGAMTKYLRQIRDKYGTFTSFFVSEKTRKYYYFDGVLKEIRQDEPRDAWYFRVREMKTDYETNVDPDLANGDALTIFTNYRVYDYDNQFIGVAGVGLTVTKVLEIIEDYQRKYQRTVYFVNRDGRVVMSSARQRQEPVHLSEREGIGRLSPTILSSEKGVYTYRMHGKEILLNTRFLPQLNWYLCVEQVEDEVAGSLWNTLLINLAICSVITAIILAATAYTIRHYQNRLEIMATSDKLTGLLNRQAFDLLFEQALKDAERSKTSLCMVLIDLDHFKSINDSYGHIAGDSVLKAIADTLGDPLRKGDPICRWGGEEFLILLRDCRLEDAIRLAEKLRETVRDMSPLPEHPDAHITISAGVGLHKAGETATQFATRIDSALYAAKNAGRDRVEVAKDA